MRLHSPEQTAVGSWSVPLASAVELELASATGASGPQGTADTIVPTLKASLFCPLWLYSAVQHDLAATPVTAHHKMRSTNMGEAER